MVEVGAGVDDADADASSDRLRPRRAPADLLEGPLLAGELVADRGGRGERREQREERADHQPPENPPQVQHHVRA
jgi:hypothetical protein